MPNIEDLKTTKFTPSITQGPSTVNEQSQIPQQPTTIKRTTIKSNGMGVVQGEQKTTIYPNGTAKNIVLQKTTQEQQQKADAANQNPKVVFSRGVKPVKDNGERVAADFSHIPQQNEELESVGITKKESITAEILGPGGPFEQWKKEKTEEFKEYMEKLEEEEALAQFESASDKTETNTESSEDADLEAEYSTIPSATFRQINIMQKESKEEMSNQNQETEEFENEFTPGLNDSYEDYDDGYFVSNPVEVDKEEQTTNTPQVVTEEIQYAKPIEGATVDSYDNAIEVESVTEEEKNIPVANNLTRSVIQVDLSDEDEENTTTVASDSSSEDEEQKENETILKNLVREKIAPISKKLDISTFTVAKKATASNNIFQATQAAVAKWVLPATGVVVSMREMSGADLEKLRELMVDNTVNPDFKNGLKIIYDHIVSPKPQSYEKWLKTTASADFEHLFMAVHIASFGEANYIPIDCVNPTCKKPYLTDSIKIMDMVKFVDKESEQKFWNLYNSDVTEVQGLYTTEIVPMSNSFAIGFKEPSLYDIYVESTYYSGQFQDKYSSTMNYLPYIDELYVIDQVNRALVPIGYTTYDNNLSKTFRSKVMKYDKVLGTLTSDQHVILATYASKISQRINWFTYQIPETTCMHCGHVHPAIEDQTPSSMVFLRNRLTLLATT